MCMFMHVCEVYYNIQKGNQEKLKLDDGENQNVDQKHVSIRTTRPTKTKQNQAKPKQQDNTKRKQKTKTNSHLKGG